LLRMKRVIGVVHAETGIEVGREDDAVVPNLAGPILVEVVRTEAQPTRAVIAGRYWEPRDLFWPGLVRDIHKVDVLARACAVRLDGFVGDREELAVPERQRRVRVGVTA